MYAHADGKAYSTFVFKLQVRKARVYAIVTGFIPPLLICMPVLLSLFLGPASWAPKRHMVSGLALVSIAFFYDSYLRQLPVLQYLTAFDKFIYCIYLWIVATMVSLAMLQYVFRDAKEDKVDLMEEGGFDETGAEKLYLTVHLRNDMLHFSFFSALIWAYMLAALFFLWLWLPEVLMCLVLLVSIVAYFTWLWLSYNRMRKRHSLEQEESGGISGILTRQAAGNTEAAKGRSFQWSMMLCCCYGPFITLCLRECCCCFGFTGGTFSEEDEKEEDPDEFPPHLYSSGGEACVICKKKRATRSASLVIPLLKPQLRKIQWRKKDNHHANATCALCTPTHIRTQKPLFCVWTNTPRISHGRLAFAITYPCMVCVSLEDA